MFGVGTAAAGTTGDGFVLVGGDTCTVKYNKPAIFSICICKHLSLMYIRLLGG